MTNIKGLNIIYLVNTTVQLCNSQDLLWDPKKDLLWLCRKYGKEIQSIRGQLNARQVQENFLGTHYFSTLTSKEQGLCYQVLLGKEPPPSMLLTPAPQLASTSTRPLIPSHKSAPSLQDSVQKQQGSSFLRPSMAHKAKTTSRVPLNGPINQILPNDAPPPPQKDNNTGTSRDSRSRSRNSSAPTMPSASRNVSPEASTTRPPKTIAEVQPDRATQRNIIYQAQTINMQNVASASRPQVIRTKKSSSRIESQASNTQLVPVFAHRSDATHVAPKSDPGAATAISTAHSEPKDRSQNPASRAQASLIAPPSASIAQPPVVAHLHPAHKIVAQRKSMMNLTNYNTAAAVSVPPAVGNIKTETSSKSLAVVGPEGLYVKSAPPTIQPAKAQQMASVSQYSVSKSCTSFVFELDATSPQVETFSKTTTGSQFVAELSADNSALLQPLPQTIHRYNSLPETPISPPQVSAHLVSEPAYRDSPVSPPTISRPLDLHTQPLNLKPTVEAPNLVSTPAGPNLVPSPSSLDSLPPSLMIGFRGPPTSPVPRMRASTYSSSGLNAKANPNPYQRYYSPPNSRESSPNDSVASAPNSRQPSPQRGPVYKAYTPPITPPMYPKTEVSQIQQSLVVQDQVLTPPALVPAAASFLKTDGPVPMERASNFVGRSSPPNILRAGPAVPQPLKVTKASNLPNPLAANPPTPRTTSHVKHDSHQGSQSDTEPQRASAIVHSAVSQHQHMSYSLRQSSLHQRTISTESNGSTASHDSEKLAQKYQLDLPNFGDGYGAQSSLGEARTMTDAKKANRPSYAGTGYGEQFRLDLPNIGKRESTQGKFMDGLEFR